MSAYTAQPYSEELTRLATEGGTTESQVSALLQAALETLGDYLPRTQPTLPNKAWINGEAVKVSRAWILGDSEWNDDGAWYDNQTWSDS